MRKARKKEIKETLADRDWWAEVTKYIPQWKLHGFTYRQEADFRTAPFPATSSYDNALGRAIVFPIAEPHSIVSLTGEQRDHLIAAFKAVSSGH